VSYQTIHCHFDLYSQPCSAAGRHLWRSPEGHGSEGRRAEVQEEVAKLASLFVDDDGLRWCTDENNSSSSSDERAV
jgi:hypothetical protein